MDTKKSKHTYTAMISGCILLPVAALYYPVICAGGEAGDLGKTGNVQKQTSVSSFLDQIIGEPNKTVDESDLLEEDNIIWYAGRWDSTLYLNARYPRTVAIRMRLLDKDTHLPLKGAGVSLKGEYEHKWTGPGAQNQIDMSIFPDLKKLKSQQRKFGLDAISDSKGLVVFSLNWQNEYFWPVKAEDKDSPTEGSRAFIHPDDIACTVRARIRHPEYKDIEIPVDFKRFVDLKPIVLDLGEKFPDFNNKHSRRTEFFEKIRAEDYSMAYRIVKNPAILTTKTKCGPYLVYDLGKVLLECTTPQTKVSRPGNTHTQEAVDTPEPRPSQQTKPSEKTVEQQDRTAQESKPDQKSIEQTKPGAQNAGANERMPGVSHTNLQGKIIDLGDGVTMRLLLIPEGEFQMGSSLDEMGRDSDEGPVHKVRIDKPFYMGAYEVTQEQYEKVMGTNPSKRKGLKFPVHMVSWKDARVFCQKLSSLVGGQFRLPTEVEWEYACRAGTTTAYYWGSRFDDQYAWSLDNSKGTLHEVGTRLPNAWGLFDMSGNLWEWCEDSYHEHYPSSDEETDPRDSSDSADRILRGGSWNVRSLFSRSANRSRNTPDIRMDYNGFRVVLDLESLHVGQ